jgi:ribosomal protein S18 acetylase RimI-like enzyme
MSDAFALHIRPYRPDDLPLLRAMTVEAFEGVSIDQNIERAFGPINGRDWGFRKGRHVDADAERCPEGIFVVEVEGRVAGYVSTWNDVEAGIGHIPNLVFAPEFRGRGLGRRLLEFALDRFRAAGLTHARIETLDQNPVGDHLYRSVGFREVARQIHVAIALDGTGGDKQHAAP